MLHNHIHSDFKHKVNRYLDYLVDYKKQFKLEEEEVFDMLSEGLRMELIVNLNGNMLHSTPMLRNFDLQFLSEMTFALKKETYSYGDCIFNVYSDISLYFGLYLGRRWRQ